MESAFERHAAFRASRLISFKDCHFSFLTFFFSLLSEHTLVRIDGTYLPWLSDLTEKLNALDPLPSKESLIPEDALLPPQVDIDFVPLTDSKLISNGNGLKESSTSSSSDTDPLQSQVGGPGKSKSPIPKVGGWKEAKLTRNDRMTSEDHYQDVRLIDMERNDGEKTE